MNEICDSAPKIPHQPERLVGHWAISLGREIFRIEEAYTTQNEPHYLGTGLHGQKVRTSCPTILLVEDHNFMEENYDEHEPEREASDA